MIRDNTHAMSLLMEAMEYHLLPDRRAGLDPERTRPRSRGNKTQVCPRYCSSAQTTPYFVDIVGNPYLCCVKI